MSLDRYLCWSAVFYYLLVIWRRRQTNSNSDVIVQLIIIIWWLWQSVAPGLSVFFLRLRISSITVIICYTCSLHPWQRNNLWPTTIESNFQCNTINFVVYPNKRRSSFCLVQRLQSLLLKSPFKQKINIFLLLICFCSVELTRGGNWFTKCQEHLCRLIII